MILIADSGSTKCTWLRSCNTCTETVRTRGINTIQHSPEQIREVLSEVWTQEIEAIYFYGAGCGPQFPEASEKLRRELEAHFGTSRIGIESDLLGAARALFGRSEGVACILGTGSNSCRCRGGQIVQSVPPLGYILGDEGSGATLGRELLNGIFKGHIPLREEFLSQSGLSYEQIIQRVYREPYANRFLASLAPFVLAHIHCDQIRAMTIRCFRTFVTRNLIHYPSGVPVSLVGGIASHFEPLIREAFAAEGYRIEHLVESPIEGLLNYHHGA